MDEGQEEVKRSRKIQSGQQICKDAGPHTLLKKGKLKQACTTF